MNVAVLCAQSRSIYATLPGVEVYDEARDAFTFAGGMPVVAHPPCRLWSKLSHFVRSANVDREMALGVFCANQVKERGGVLEHPAYSRLWEVAGLPMPGQSSQVGFTLSVDQWHFGHLGQKNTWLFFAGVSPRDLPETPFRLDSVARRPVEKLSHRQREATPPALAAWLVECARRTAVFSV